MYLEPNNPSLSFANFLDAAIRDKAEIKPFPYTLEVCRCRYCSYCQNGKCALKRCCCMSERVKAKSCTFAELLRDCFANFKDNVFQFRLRIACERASELKTCFLDEGHKGRFYEGVSQNTPTLLMRTAILLYLQIAQVFVNFLLPLRSIAQSKQRLQKIVCGMQVNIKKAAFVTTLTISICCVISLVVHRDIGQRKRRQQRGISIV